MFRFERSRSQSQVTITASNAHLVAIYRSVEVQSGYRTWFFGVFLYALWTLVPIFSQVQLVPWHSEVAVLEQRKFNITQKGDPKRLLFVPDPKRLRLFSFECQVWLTLEQYFGLGWDATAKQFILIYAPRSGPSLGARSIDGQ